LNLLINLPNNLVTKAFVQQVDIPCFCRIWGNVSFELEFQSPLPQAIGRVEGWTTKLISERAWVLVGGVYTHYNFAQVTLQPIEAGLYAIKFLKFFYEDSGWLPLIKDGEWSEPMLNTQTVLDTLNTMYPKKKGNKKRQKLMEMLAKIGK
jgi:hypothetical protein